MKRQVDYILVFGTDDHSYKDDTEFIKPLGGYRNIKSKFAETIISFMKAGYVCQGNPFIERDRRVQAMAKYEN